MLSHDLLLINGNTTLGGTLALSCFGNCNYAVGDQIVILDATGLLNGTFANVTKSGFATGNFDVIYDTALARVLLRVTEPVTPAPVPEPRTMGLIMLAAGLLARCRRGGTLA